MIKIEFPADRTDIALAIGQALVAVGSGAAVEQQADHAHQSRQSEAEYHDAITRHQPEQAEIIADDAVAVAGRPEEVTAEEYDPNVAPSADIETGSTTPADAAGVSQTATDGNGVAFNAEYCAKAKEPFYTSGKRSGQWKKRKGVLDEKYDEWYASERSNSQDAEVEQEEPAEVFGEQQDAMAAQVFGQAEPQAEAEWAPSNTGELLNWVAEQQAAGTLTTQQVQDMYVTLQLPFAAMTDPANCVKAYHYLKGLI